MKEMERIEPDEIGLVMVDEAAESFGESVAGVRGDGANDDLLLDAANSFGRFGAGKVHAEPDALEHFGEIAEIVLGLNEERGSGRCRRRGVQGPGGWRAAGRQSICQCLIDL